MKSFKIAMLAAAGLGLVSQSAFADTLPGQAIPSVSRVHGVKIVRAAEKRRGVSSSDEAASTGGDGGLGLGLAGLAGLAGGFALGRATNNNNNSGSPAI